MDYYHGTYPKRHIHPGESPTASRLVFSDQQKYLSLMRIGSVGDLHPQGSKGQTYHQIPHLENFIGGIWILFRLLVSWRVYIYILRYVSFFLFFFQLDNLNLKEIPHFFLYVWCVFFCELQGFVSRKWSELLYSKSIEIADKNPRPSSGTLPENVWVAQKFFPWISVPQQPLILTFNAWLFFHWKMDNDGSCGLSFETHLYMNISPIKHGLILRHNSLRFGIAGIHSSSKTT